jgi:fructokinase
LKTNISVFGEILADVFPDKTVIGGAPFNVARHLNAFRTHPTIISRIGNDALKKIILDELSSKQLDPIGVQCDPSKPTGQVMVSLEDGQPSYDILDDQAYDHIHAGMTHLAMMVITPEIKYFGTLVQRSLHARLALDTFIHDKPCPTFLDLNLREPWYTPQIVEHSLERCQYAKMNEAELRITAALLQVKGKTNEALAQAIQAQFSLSQIIVTCGDDGSWVIDNKGILTKQKAFKPSVFVDAVGAGDAFASVYLLGILYEWPIEKTLARANQFASAICGIHGAAPESLNFYDQFLIEWNL